VLFRSRADRAARGHHAGGAGIAQAHRHDRVVARVAQHLEAILHQFTACLERAHGIGQERGAVAEHLELHPARSGVAQLFQQFAAQACDADGIVRTEAAGGVGQDGVPVGLERIEQRAAARIDQALTPHGDGDGAAAARLEGSVHRGVVRVLAGAGHEPTAERERTDGEGRKGHGGCMHGFSLRRLG
jgi:hypothetical protein